jgi:hypothetical protein
MFVGETNSGKTTAVRQLLTAEGLPVKIVNHRDPTEVLPDGYTRISWEDALKAKDCNLIVEDLIACKKPELEKLQEILNYTAHHQTIPTVVLITHSCTSNGIFAVLENLTHMCFMAVRTSSKSVLNALRSYNVSKTEQRRMLDNFLADAGLVPHGYWVLDVKTMQFGRHPGALSPPAGSRAAVAVSVSEGPEAKLAPYRRTAETYLNHFSVDPKKSLAIFDFLMTKAPLTSLNPVNLEFTLRDVKSGRVVGVSLLDYLNTITTQLSPSRTVLDLHVYLRRHVTLPRCFIANRHKKFD